MLYWKEFGSERRFTLVPGMHFSRVELEQPSNLVRRNPVESYSSPNKPSNDASVSISVSTTPYGLLHDIQIGIVPKVWKPLKPIETHSGANFEPSHSLPSIGQVFDQRLFTTFLKFVIHFDWLQKPWLNILLIGTKTFFFERLYLGQTSLHALLSLFWVLSVFKQKFYGQIVDKHGINRGCAWMG